ncbi:c-type cytochrome [Oxalobacteraceae bacterium OM1]|nr:c-type cytochrome [Oxalobacteraceae bacterium OM1]
MKGTILALLVAAGFMAAPAFANGDLAKSKNCMGCHATDTKVLGPAFKDVAKKYAGQKDAENKLVQKVMQGGSGTWGAIAMPANTSVSEQEARTLVKWVLSLK